MGKDFLDIFFSSVQKHYPYSRTNIEATVNRLGEFGRPAEKNRVVEGRHRYRLIV